MDKAYNLLSNLRTIRNATSNPVYTEIDINVFFRNYISAKYAELPSNVRLVLPTSRAAYKFTTFVEFIKSILDNIIKNAVEAMPQGGDIQIEWVYVEPDEKLLVEVSDNGPGIPQDILESLQKGKSVRTTKEKGSGIGIMTIFQMVKGLDGKVDVRSSNLGTNWTIQLTSYHELVSEEIFSDIANTYEEGEANLNENSLGG